MDDICILYAHLNSRIKIQKTKFNVKEIFALNNAFYFIVRRFRNVWDEVIDHASRNHVKSHTVFGP